MTLEEVFEKVKKQRWSSYAGLGKLEEYVLGGNEAALAALPPAAQYNWWLSEFTRALPDPPELTDQHRRMLRAAVKIDPEYPMEWFAASLNREKVGEDFFEVLREAFGKSAPETTAAEVLRHVQGLTAGNRPTSAGRFLLSLPKETLAKAVSKTKFGHATPHALLTLLFDHALDRVDAVLEVLIPQCEDWAVAGVFKEMMARDGAKYRKTVEEHASGEKDSYQKVRQYQTLFEFAPGEYREKTIAACRELLTHSPRNNNEHFMAEWVLPTFGKELLGELEEYYRKSDDRDHEKEIPVLGKVLGADAVRIYRAMAENTANESVRLGGLSAMIALKDATLDREIEENLRAGLGGDNASAVLAFLPVAGAWKPEKLGEFLWPLMEHKSKQVRDAAVRALAKGGEAIVEKGTSLLVHKRGDVRQAAASLLAAVGTEQALSALESRLDEESNDDVRDQMLIGLEAAWAKQGRKVSKKDIAKRIARAQDKLKAPVAPWAKESALPALKWTDGKKLTETEVRYMMYRQSRAKEMLPDPEAKAIYALVNRETGGAAGDFAAALLKAFFASKQDAGDRWAMTIAGALGDDRIVAPMAAQIRHWIEHNRGKLAEYAVESLALLGSDAALLAVDAMAIRYRSKMKNVGRAAAEAFIRAAEEQGITPEELGDRVVPWLGFKKDEPYVVGKEPAKFEVRIGQDFKLAFVDLQKNKPVKSLPKSVPAEITAELKETAASLREVIKAQTLRLENLLVRQRHWPAARWKELFLGHPVLRPFATRLIWAEYDAEGKLRGTFRPLEDRSLTTNTDDTYSFAGGEIGMVHPLELEPAVREAWQTHLADYEIEPPFPQIGRSVVLATAEQSQEKTYKKVEGKSLNGMTFKGRAERLGWYRGSVVDGGAVSSYYKSFATAGVDVILFVDGIYMGMGIEDQMTMGTVRFVRANTVKRGSYIYEEPYQESDPRIIPFGEVPPIVFSEAMGDLSRIAGEKAAEEEE